MLAIAALSLAIGVFTSGNVAAQVEASTPKGGPYPSRVIRLIVPYAAGGNADIVARILTGKLSPVIGQQVVVDNRGGAGGNIGAELAAHAAPDGYTLVLGTNTHAINMSLYAHPGYDFAKDFAPISLVSSAPLVLIVHPSLPVRTARDLIALARSKPGKLNYGTGGSGSSAHIITELFKTITGVDIVHVPYKGVSQATTDLLGGQIQIMFNSTSTAMEHVHSGRVKALGVSSAQRSQLAPGVPTLAESGLPGFEATIWQGVLAPAGTPQPIIERMNHEIMSLLAAGDIRKQFIAQGVVAMPSTSDQFRAYIKSEIAKWAKVIKASGAKVD
jgi:tripartite-type tricarboxylate transporter receptor subunit TctC